MSKRGDVYGTFLGPSASWLAMVAVLVCLVFPTRPFLAQQAATVRFNALEVFVDSGTKPLAAYQLTFIATSGEVKIVSIEGGEHPAFKEPPNYDPKAIQHERAILAAFNTISADNLPKGRTRVATVHVQITGATAPVYAVKLDAAADAEGAPVAGQTSVQEKGPNE